MIGLNPNDLNNYNPIIETPVILHRDKHDPSIIDLKIQSLKNTPPLDFFGDPEIEQAPELDRRVQSFLVPVIDFEIQK